MSAPELTHRQRDEKEKEMTQVSFILKTNPAKNKNHVYLADISRI